MGPKEEIEIELTQEQKALLAWLRSKSFARPYDTLRQLFLMNRKKRRAWFAKNRV